MSSHSPPGRYRRDIQALRGFAVLVVVFYHAKISYFSAGYRGVDVFFVISGFLITRLIKHGIENGHFRFSDFYFRRAKRLLPAAYVTFLVTALLAPLFLTSLEMNQLPAQMAGAVTFTANFVLWQQQGYFHGAAELIPLLHVWSLAIEEQYYFILPALLVFVPRRLWLRGAILVLLASLALFLLRIENESTFFLLPGRAWELMIGSVGALIVPGEHLRRALKILCWPALAALLALSMVSVTNYRPGPEVVLICLATLIVILSHHPLLSKGPLMHGLSKVGDMSYSLYLVHWPLFAFFNNVWVGASGADQPTTIWIGLILLSLLLAYLLNRYVEEPVRRAEIKGTLGNLARTVATSLSLILITFGTSHLAAGASAKDYAYIRRVNDGFGAACRFYNAFEPLPECRNSDHPEILYWGDSFAMHLVPGALGADGGAPAIAQATSPVCGALLGLGAVQDRGDINLQWAEHCIDFNEAVLAYLKQTDSIKIVVLSSPFEQFVNTGEFRLLKRAAKDGSEHLVEASVAEAVAGMKRTVDAIRALGKRVVVVAPPPSAYGFDIGRCIERIDNHLPILGVVDDCNINRDTYLKMRRHVLELLAALPEQAGVEVIRFDDYLCDNKRCRTYIDGTFIYRDTGHFSHEGAVFVTNKLSLLDQIRRAAR
jgi:peptidoglycan/LPS O-acetylase OafA/YrhL